MAEATGTPTAPPGYKIIKKMGQGGMAAVYLAVQESFGRQVALKIMSDELGKDSVWAKRFIHEAQIVAQLSHPNIVPVFDVGTHDGRFYISMELLKGGNLDAKIEKGLTIPEIIRIVVGVAAGLDFAGEKGFVHRDIKPDNIMFREDGSPVILDFGIVKQKGGENKMTQTGTIVGTTGYMSPEQAMGKELDEGSDIYSLGIMFYELLTGHRPFYGDSDVAVLLKHVQEPPPPLSSQLSIFQAVIDKMLAKQRSDRYKRARDMIEHLQQLEPQIRELVARQQAMFAGSGSTDATAVQTAVGAKAVTAQAQAVTAVAGAVKTKTAAEATAELTDVLSSAKATIKDFSEEARLRKARNTKRMIAAAVVVVVLALGYAAYQQFYVAPRAKAAAAEENKLKIAELWSAAEAASEQLDPKDLKNADALITQYLQILQLDQGNADVHDAMGKLGAKYVELGSEALQANDLALAARYKAYAEQLAPNDAALASFKEKLMSEQAKSSQLAVEGQAKQQQIEQWLANAKSNIRAGNNFSPADNNAYDQLQLVLKNDPANVEAKSLVASMLDKVFSDTESQIRNNQLSAASDNLDLLERYGADKAHISSLKTTLASARQKAAEQAKQAGIAQQKDELLNKAMRLKRDQRTMSSNDDLRDLYTKVLRIDPSNSQALEGMDDTSRFEGEQAQKAIKQRDFSRASQYISEIEKFTPIYSGLSSLKSDLAQAKTSAQKADQLLAQAEQLTKSTKTDDAKRQDLAKALAAIESVQQLDPSNPGLASAVSALETEYFATIQQLMSQSNNADLVNAYFRDESAYANWPTARLSTLQINFRSASSVTGAPADKPKPKRVMSGGF